MAKLRKLSFDIDFAEIAIKGRSSIGNTITKYPVKKIIQKSKGVSTLGGRDIWFDETVKRLNTDSRGKYLGSFQGDDSILVVYADGTYELTNFDLSNHFDDRYFVIEKFHPDKVISAVHYDAANKSNYVKRFVVEQTTQNKKINFISDSTGSSLNYASTKEEPIVKISFIKDGKTQPAPLELNLAQFIDVKGMKANGNKISKHKVKDIEERISDADEVNEEELSDISRAVSQIKAGKNIEIEITNPDVEIDEKGQIKLIYIIRNSSSRTLYLLN
jgi:topoisomerase-4 subunit A